jgi:hypothetical protein
MNKSLLEKIENRFDKDYTELLKETYRFQKKTYDPSIAYTFFHKIKKVLFKEILLAEKRKREGIIN